MGGARAPGTDRGSPALGPLTLEGIRSAKARSLLGKNVNLPAQPDYSVFVDLLQGARESPFPLSEEAWRYTSALVNRIRIYNLFDCMHRACSEIDKL